MIVTLEKERIQMIELAIADPGPRHSDVLENQFSFMCILHCGSQTLAGAWTRHSDILQNALLYTHRC